MVLSEWVNGAVYPLRGGVPIAARRPMPRFVRPGKTRGFPVI